MGTEKEVDFQAVNRVARRVDVMDVRLIDVAIKSSAKSPGALRAEIEHSCSPGPLVDGSFEVRCKYLFRIFSGEAERAQADFTYALVYSVAGQEPIDEGDLSEFAFANGTYHSWPFVREFLTDLTGRMGLPPYTLPVFRFNPKPRPAQATPPSEVTAAADGEAVQ